MKDLAVIIVSYNTQKLLKTCLESLLISLIRSGLTYEIIIVDNASTDGTLAMLKKDFSGIRLIENSKNLGFGQANNMGILQSNSKYILLLNSDTRVLPDTIIKTYSLIKSQNQTGILGCRILNNDDSIQASVGYYPNLWRVFCWMFFIDDIGILNKIIKAYHVNAGNFYNREQEVDWVTGAFMLLRRELVNRVRFDRKMFMYVEEVDFCASAKNKGWKIIYSPITSIYHQKGASGTGVNAGLIEEFNGLVYLYNKHSLEKVRLLKLLIRLGALFRIIIFGIMRKREKSLIYQKYLRMAG